LIGLSSAPTSLIDAFVFEVRDIGYEHRRVAVANVRVAVERCVTLRPAWRAYHIPRITPSAFLIVRFCWISKAT